MIIKQEVANQLLKYLNQRLTIAELVEWAEFSIMEGNIEPESSKIIMQALGRMGVSDVKEFGLLWEDCEAIMKSLGYDIKVDAINAA
ncbi:MAG TPA: hypothetical protein VEA37_00410 [Flavobacterium sp.]|nr:hypothetical protein [Flavobacterium sp.]